MTLVLALGNADYVVQVSDRQLTDGRGHPCVLPENKATVLTLADSRLLVGFAGLARTGSFRTGKWILETLLEAARPDHAALDTIERFTELATQRFEMPDLQSVTADNRRLSVMFTGFNDTRPPPNLIAAIVTNFQDFESGRDEAAWNAFKATYWSYKAGPTPDEVSWVQRIGTWTAMDDIEDVARLRRPLEERRPARVTIDTAVGIMRSIAGRDSANGRIGQSLNTALLPVQRPSPPSAGIVLPQFDYRPAGSSHTLYGANEILSLPSAQIALMEPRFEAVKKTGRPMAVQKVGRNKLCPCGSGKKYKRCHGR